MTKLYVLFYDIDSDNREDWNVFYTPYEIFPTAELRNERIDFIRANVTDPELSFETNDIDISTTSNFEIAPKVANFNEVDEDEVDEDEVDDVEVNEEVTIHDVLAEFFGLYEVDEDEVDADEGNKSDQFLRPGLSK